jgi:hypothetical protein
METPEQRAQSAKFGYKAPESVYKKHDPKASLVGSGAFLEKDIHLTCQLNSLWTHSPYRSYLCYFERCRKSLYWRGSNGFLPAPKCREES